VAQQSRVDLARKNAAAAAAAAAAGDGDAVATAPNEAYELSHLLRTSGNITSNRPRPRKLIESTAVRRRRESSSNCPWTLLTAHIQRIVQKNRFDSPD
jgi:hypothetical protein